MSKHLGPSKSDAIGEIRTLRAEAQRALLAKAKEAAAEGIKRLKAAKEAHVLTLVEMPLATEACVALTVAHAKSKAALKVLADQLAPPPASLPQGPLHPVYRSTVNSKAASMLEEWKKS